MSGELVFANVLDQRVWQAQGDQGSPGIYLLGLPGRALPFTIYRAWKVARGLVNEEIRLIGPSGRTIHTWGPNVREMRGAMDLTMERDVVEGAMLDESGVYLVSFIIDGAIVGETTCPVFLQEAPTKLPKETEDGLKKSDVIWVGMERGDRRSTIPAWFAYKNGKIYVVSQKEPGPDEQTVPGVPGATDLVIVTRRKGRDTSLEEFHAAVRLLDGQEWEEAAKALADRRRSRVGSPDERIARWRGSCAIAELTPILPA